MPPPPKIGIAVVAGIAVIAPFVFPAMHPAGVAVLWYIICIALFRAVTLEATLWDFESTCFVLAAVLIAWTPLFFEDQSDTLTGWIQTQIPTAAALVLAFGAHYALVRGGAGYDRSLVMGGRVVVVTGANTGIGLETAAALAGLGATVILGCRDTSRMAVAAAEIRRRHPRAVIHCFQLDLSSNDSVHAFVEALNAHGIKPAVLVNNAGVLLTSRRLTSDGVEASIAANHLGPFLLTRLLLPTLLKQPDPRVVMVSSSLHHMPDHLDMRAMKTREGFSPSDFFSVYADTKLCNMVFTRELHRRYGDKGLVAVCVHPGTVQTDVTRDMHSVVQTLYRATTFVTRLFMKSASEGCECSVFAATDRDIRKHGGAYLVHCRSASYNVLADDAALGTKLWEWSATLTEGMR